MTRRSRGEGSVTRDPERGGYRGRISVVDPFGRQRSYHPRARTKGAVVRLMIDWRDRVTAQGVSSEMTLENWVAVWLDGLRTSTRRKDSTVDGYADRMRLYVVPQLGHLRLSQLTARQIEIWAHTQIRTQDGLPAAAHTRRNVFSDLRACLRAAHKRGLVTESLADQVEPPDTSRSKESRAYSRGEVIRLLEAARQMPPGMHARTAIALGLGLRQGELLGLRLSDWDGTRLRIQRSRARVVHSHGPSCTALHEHSAARCPVRVRVPIDGDTKRPSSVRTLYPTADIARIIDEQAAAVRQRVPDGDPHLLGTFHGNAVNRHNDTRSWKALCQKAGVECLGTHSCRRTAVTMLDEAGVPATTIGRILGWSTKNVHEMLATYSRPSIDHQREALERAHRGLFSDGSAPTRR